MPFSFPKSALRLRISTSSARGTCISQSHSRTYSFLEYLCPLVFALDAVAFQSQLLSSRLAAVRFDCPTRRRYPAERALSPRLRPPDIAGEGCCCEGSSPQCAQLVATKVSAAEGWEQAQQEAAKNGKILPGASSWGLIPSRRVDMHSCSHASARWGALFWFTCVSSIPDVLGRCKLVWHVPWFEEVALWASCRGLENITCWSTLLSHLRPKPDWAPARRSARVEAARGCSKSEETHIQPNLEPAPSQFSKHS